MWLDLGLSQGKAAVEVGATRAATSQQPNLYPVKQLNSLEVQEALCAKVHKADLEDEQKEQLLDLLLRFED